MRASEFFQFYKMSKNCRKVSARRLSKCLHAHCAGAAQIEYTVLSAFFSFILIPMVTVLGIAIANAFAGLTFGIHEEYTIGMYWSNLEVGSYQVTGGLISEGDPTSVNGGLLDIEIGTCNPYYDEPGEAGEIGDGIF